jgi:hypothetical protein
VNREDIIRLARDAGLTGLVEADVIENFERFAALVAEAERNECERLKHAMREAMYLLDQPEPRPHAAFSELLLALNPDLPSAIRARGGRNMRVNRETQE